MTVRYLSLFSGIEAATVAWRPLGWQAVAFAQFDPEHDYRRGPDFASAVLGHHFPSVPNLGDVTKLDEIDIATLGPIDVVVFGSPCQDLSVAGNRAGLAGERSGLFFDALRIVRWAREHCGCRYALWENVPGAFSSNKGRDFAVVVAGLAGIADDFPVPPKGWGAEGVALGEEGLVEWAVLDAQHFGVAQRRRRVFALADFGDWRRRPPILLEPSRLRGDCPARAGAVEETATASRASSAGDSARIDCTPQGIAGTVSSKWVKGTGGPAGDEHYNLVVPAWPQETADPVVVGEHKTWTHEGNTFRVRNLVPAFASPMAVRRLTPRECERLQGFPDDYTLVPYRGKPAADGPRYRALGNSMAVPVMRWIGESIEVADLF